MSVNTQFTSLPQTSTSLCQQVSEPKRKVKLEIVIVPAESSSQKRVAPSISKNPVSFADSLDQFLLLQKNASTLNSSSVSLPVPRKYINSASVNPSVTPFQTSAEQILQAKK